MRVVSPHRSIINYAVSGSVDATYQAQWLTTSSVGRPARRTGNLSLNVSSVGSIDVVAVINHNIAQSAVIGLGALGFITTAPWRADNIPYNWFKRFNPTTPGLLMLTVTSNPTFTAIGMLYAGLSYEWNGFLNGRSFDPQRPFPWEGEFSSLAPYDPGLSAQRRVSGTVIMNNTHYEELLLTCEAQRLGNRPILWIEDDAINDAWLCQFGFSSVHNEGHWFVNLEITEIPRLRWLG